MADREYKPPPTKGAEAVRRWRQKHADGLAERNHAYYLRTRETQLAQRRARYAANREKILAEERQRYRATLDYQRARRQRYRTSNLERARARARDYRARNVQRMNAAARLWAKVNRERHNAHRSRRRAAEVRAVPLWADTSRMIAIYRDAAEPSERTGVEHHVDHIVPLQHDLVCGLHCEDNLAVVDALTNRKKGNRYWPDMP